MESNEKISKTLKKVRFAEEEKEQRETTFTLKRKPSMKTILKQWIHQSRAGEYEQLKQELLSWNQKGMTTKKIFAQEGSFLLGWAAGTARVYESLQFMCENVEKDILQEILAQDNFDILKSLLAIESGLDESRKATQKELAVRHKKFVLLLNIDPEGVQRFMQENDTVKWLGKEVKVSFSLALNEHSMLPPLQKDIKNEEVIMAQTNQTSNKKQKITGDELAVTSPSLTHPTQTQHPTSTLVSLENINAVTTQLQLNPDIQQSENTMLNAYHTQTDPYLSTINDNSVQNKSIKKEVGKKRRPSK